MGNWEDTESRYIRTVLHSARRPNNTVKFPEVELALLRHLAPSIPERIAIDVGAFRGSYTRTFRDCGFEVFAFEPIASRVQDLRAKWRADPGVHIERAALSNEDGIVGIHLGEWQNANEADLNSGDVFNSLENKPWTEELHFPKTLLTVRRRLAWYVQSGLIPAEIGILKTDAEGHDRAVLEGAWPHLGRLTLCEYWNREFSFSQGGDWAKNDLSHYEDFFASRVDVHRLVIGRDATETDIFFQVNPRVSEPNSWGNVLFTHDADLFTKAVEWCMDVMGARSCRA